MENITDRLKDSTIDKIKKVMNDYGCDLCSNLADFVASICNIDKEDMLSSSSNVEFIQARWLFWLAYKNLTKDTYRRISINTAKINSSRVFSIPCIIKGVSKMSMMITEEHIWNKRWNIIKQVIKDNKKDKKTDNTIVIQVPRDIRENIKIEIKDK